MKYLIMILIAVSYIIPAQAGEPLTFNGKPAKYIVRLGCAQSNPAKKIDIMHCVHTGGILITVDDEDYRISRPLEVFGLPDKFAIAIKNNQENFPVGFAMGIYDLSGNKLGFWLARNGQVTVVVSGKGLTRVIGFVK